MQLSDKSKLEVIPGRRARGLNDEVAQPPKRVWGRITCTLIPIGEMGVFLWVGTQLGGCMQKKVFIVDDSQTVRASVRISLEKFGYEVIEAEDGEAEKQTQSAHYAFLQAQRHQVSQGQYHRKPPARNWACREHR